MEKELLTRAKAGDKDALIKLIMNKQNEYYRLAFAYVRNKEDALDAMQDMIVTIYDRLHQLKNNNAFESWSKTILVNSCKKILRKNKKILHIEDFEINQTSNNDHSPPTVLRIDIANNLQKLNDKQKDALILKYYLDLDYETISKITKSPIGTVKSRVFNGLKRLNELLGGAYHG